ncbi:peptidyl-tRNA hydrolase domain-containing protein [Phlyctema vagabunda]|uniref:Peptidyl-tRNA hydrolase domain-containing protein n=1 Tax=Phlyctema vagabunda TaxID=108571 RepID=A0ABR4PSC2_9HELO
MLSRILFKRLRCASRSHPVAAVFSYYTRAYSSRGPYEKDYDADELAEARKWLASFSTHPIPHDISKTDFSRSSGAGGQKTNKTSSKATTRWPMEKLEQHLPRLIRSEIRKSTYYARNSNSILIACDEAREQSKNQATTHQKLASEIMAICKKVIPGETSPEQAKKVKLLQKAENASRLAFKKQHGDKKRSRSGGGRSD